jgi:hypothetical protein
VIASYKHLLDMSNIIFVVCWRGMWSMVCISEILNFLMGIEGLTFILVSWWLINVGLSFCISPISEMWCVVLSR